MSEYGRLRDAFVQVCGPLVREPANQTTDDDRDPSFICWVAKNVWLCPDDPDGKDVQIHTWHGEAWVSGGDRSPGLWCGLNIEFKDAFRAALRNADHHSFSDATQTLRNYRVSFGSKEWPSKEFRMINREGLDPGRCASGFDYQAMFLEIRGLDGKPRSRPQLQIYRQIGDWKSAFNTVERLTGEIAAVRSELAGLFRLVTNGNYPP